MRKTSALCLLLLAGCATAQPKASPHPGAAALHPPGALPEPGTIQGVTAQPARYAIVNGPCHTAHPMPTARRGPLDRPSGTIPNAAGPKALPYIPNACPVTVGPLARKAVSTSLPRKTPPPAPRR